MGVRDAGKFMELCTIFRFKDIGMVTWLHTTPWVQPTDQFYIEPFWAACKCHASTNSSYKIDWFKFGHGHYLTSDIKSFKLSTRSMVQQVVIMYLRHTDLPKTWLHDLITRIIMVKVHVRDPAWRHLHVYLKSWSLNLLLAKGSELCITKINRFTVSVVLTALKGSNLKEVSLTDLKGSKPCVTNIIWYYKILPISGWMQEAKLVSNELSSKPVFWGCRSMTSMEV